MLLVIDAGNSNVTLGVYRGNDLLAQWRLVTSPLRSGEGYGDEVRRLFRIADLDTNQVESVVIASVVPPLNATLEQMARAHFHVEPFFVDHTTDTGLKILCEPPDNVGADRIVDAVAAVNNYGAPCIVVDFGTATTFNAINTRREYLGGLICPGITIAADALFERTAKLPRVEIKRPQRVIGSNTVDAIQSGLYYGYLSLVDGVLEKMMAELDEKPRVIATGGSAQLIAGGSKYIELVDEDLILTGLRLIYDRVAGKKQ